MEYFKCESHLAVHSLISYFFSFYIYKKPLLQDSFESCIVLIHDNLTLCGQNDKHLLKWSPHDLKNVFLETSLNVKLPSTPHGDQSKMAGYSFENKSAIRASYYHAMNLLGKINEVHNLSKSNATQSYGYTLNKLSKKNFLNSSAVISLWKFGWILLLCYLSKFHHN